jgi:hypothetical protein
MEENRFSSRKFILAVMSLIAPMILVWFGKIDASTYSTISIGIAGLYYTGNVVEKSSLVSGSKS